MESVNLQSRVVEMMKRSEVIVDDDLDACVSPALRDYAGEMQKPATTDIKRIFRGVPQTAHILFSFQLRLKLKRGILLPLKSTSTLTGPIWPKY